MLIPGEHMKTKGPKILSFITIITLMIFAYNGNGNNRQDDYLKNIDDIVEGHGPSLDLSNLEKIEDIISSVILYETYPLLVRYAGFNDDTGRNEFCTNGRYIGIIEQATTRGESGEVVTSGTLEVVKTSETSATYSAKATADFKNYKYRDHQRNETVILNGVAYYSNSMDFNGDIKKSCGSKSGDTSTDLEVSDSIQGTISISGDTGAAIMFALSTKSSFTNRSIDQPENYGFTGTATIKSGGKAAECTINSNGLESGSFVTCK